MPDFDDPRRFGNVGGRMTVQAAKSSFADRFPVIAVTDISTLLERGEHKRLAAKELRAATARQNGKGLRKGASSTPATYVIGIEGSPLVKIGYTSGDPKARVAQLQTGLPMQLTLLWSTFGDYEDELHDRFAAYRVRGEWFDLTPLGDPVKVVQATVKEINAPFTT